MIGCMPALEKKWKMSDNGKRIFWTSFNMVIAPLAQRVNLIRYQTLFTINTLETCQSILNAIISLFGSLNAMNAMYTFTCHLN